MEREIGKSSTADESEGRKALRNFLTRTYLANGLNKERADELTTKVIEILHSGIPQQEQLRQMKQLDRDNGIPDYRPRLPGVVVSRSLYVAGGQSSVLSFPGPTYK